MVKLSIIKKSDISAQATFCGVLHQILSGSRVDWQSRIKGPFTGNPPMALVANETFLCYHILKIFLG